MKTRNRWIYEKGESGYTPSGWRSGTLFIRRLGRRWNLYRSDLKSADTVIGSYASKEDAMKDAESLANPSRQRAILAATTKRLRRNPARPKSRAPSIQKKYNTTVNALHVEYFQGYAEDIRYLRGADGKPYSHVVETDSAELYLCEHATYGKCLLIVDPSGKTPLWG